MEIPILLVGINGRYKKKLKGEFVCEPEQRKRYLRSIAGRTLCKKLCKKQVSYEKGRFPAL